MIAVESPDLISFRIGDSLANVERQLIEITLKRCRTKDEAARILGVSTKTLYNKLRRYQRTEPESRADGRGPRAPDSAYRLN